MTNKKSVEVEGKNTQQAIKEALKILGVPRHMVIVKVLTEEHKGLFGMKGAKGARVRVSLKE